MHGLERVSPIGEITLDGPIRRVSSTQLFNSARGTFEGAPRATSYGPGMGVIHFDLMGRVTLVSATTPIEDDAVEVRFTLYHSGDPIAEKIGAGFAAEVARQFHEDIPIWENKRYQPTPALAPTERPVTEFRRWAAQFYPEMRGAGRRLIGHVAARPAAAPCRACRGRCGAARRVARRGRHLVAGERRAHPVAHARRRRPSAPAATTTTALTCSPSTRSGTPTTAASTIAGCSTSRFSISIG